LNINSYKCIILQITNRRRTNLHFTWVWELANRIVPDLYSGASFELGL